MIHEHRVLNPATEELVATVPATSAAEVSTAVTRAARAQRTTWGCGWEYGDHTAAATEEVVSSGRSRASTSTRWPASSSRTAQDSPTTPAPTTITRRMGPSLPAGRRVGQSCPLALRITSTMPPMISVSP